MGDVIYIYVYNVTGIDGEFKIGVKNFMVTSEAEDGNIFHMEGTTNPPVAPEAATAPPEAEGIQNQKACVSIFDAVMTIQPGRVALTPVNLVELWALGLEIDDDNQLVPENLQMS